MKIKLAAVQMDIFGTVPNRCESYGWKEPRFDGSTISSHNDDFE